MHVNLGPLANSVSETGDLTAKFGGI